MSDEAAESVENPTWTCVQAVLLLLLGTVMAAMFADPLVDAVHNFSNATKIPSFFISFIAMPLATNSSEAVSAIIFASRKKQRTSSLTFSEVCFMLPLLVWFNTSYINNVRSLWFVPRPLTLEYSYILAHIHKLLVACWI